MKRALPVFCALSLFLMGCVSSPASRSDINARIDTRGGTALCDAVLANDVYRVNYLLENGAIPNVTNSGGITALGFAVEKNYLDIAKVLLSNGADPDVVFVLEGSVTPLHIAATLGFQDMVALLLASFADPNVMDAEGEWPLTLAVFKEYTAIVSLLLDHGADPNVDNQIGWSCLHIAVESGNLEIASALISKGADVNRQILTQRLTPLHFAVGYRSKPILELLLANGADPSITDSGGWTPLMFAISKQYTEMLEPLGM